jgi:hypothetical protein
VEGSREPSFELVQIGVEAEGNLSLDNASLGALAYTSWCCCVLFLVNLSPVQAISRVPLLVRVFLVACLLVSLTVCRDCLICDYQS